MAFLAPLLGAGGAGGAGTAGAGGTAAGAGAGTAGAASGGFSSLVPAAGSSATGAVGAAAPAAAGGSIANAAGNVGQSVFGGPMADVGDMTTPAASMSAAQQGGGLFSKMADFTQSDTGNMLQEASRQGKPLNLYPQGDMFGGDQQSMQMNNSLSPNAISFLQQYLRRR